MNFLPWAISDKKPGLVLDNCGCVVIDLTHFSAIGPGHSAVEVAEFLVSRANVLAEQEKQEQKKAENENK